MVSKANGIRAAADGDVTTLELFLRQFPQDQRIKTTDESPELGATRIPSIQWRELLKTLFREAIDNGQLASVQFLLGTTVWKQAFGDADDRQRLLSQLLAWAMREDYSEIVACLLTHSADPNALIPADDENEDTEHDLPPLHLAARLGSVDMAELLLLKGASVNARHEVDGSTALHEAARQNEHEMILLLLQHGGDLNAIDTTNSESPLHVAAKKGNHAAASMLLQCRANATLVNRRGSSAMHLALVEAHENIVHLLTASSADTASGPTSPTHNKWIKSG